MGKLMLYKGAKAKRGGVLVLALVAILAASLLGVALMTNTGNLAGLAHRSADRTRALALAESSLGLAVQQRWVRGDTALGHFMGAEGVRPLAVQFDTVGIWLRGSVQAVAGEQTVKLQSVLAKPLDTLVFRHGLVLLGGEAPASYGALHLNGSMRSGAGVHPSSDKIRQEFEKMANAVRARGQQQLASAFASSDSVRCRYTGNQRWWEPSELPGCSPLRVENGDFSLEASRLSLEATPGGTRDIRVQGAVLLRGNMVFDTLRIVAEGAVVIADGVRVGWLEIYTRSSLKVSGESSLAGVLVSEGEMQFDDAAEVRCCSYVLAGSTLNMQGESRIEGYTVALPGATGGTGIVRIADRARALGIVYAGGSLENQGFIGGTALASRLGCGADSPSDCVPDGSFDRDSMPPDLRQSPLQDFGSPKRIVTLNRWVQ